MKQQEFQWASIRFEFTWHLEPKGEFQTPEAVMVYSPAGLNGMSQNFHELFNHRLVRGI